VKVHHIGIAVESLERALPAFEKVFGKAADSSETVEDQKVRVAVFNLDGARIELLEATAQDSPIAKFIARRGPGIHHMTLQVSGLAEKLAQLERSGIELVDRAPRAGAGTSRIAFLHPRSTSGVLIELVEEP
jgi:methylmalonyl-CoA/ethylmalonyl-CoA epimerase